MAPTRRPMSLTTGHTSHLSVTHPAEGPMRRRVDASRVRNPVPVRSWPRWSRRIPTGIAHGIGHGHARVFMEFHWQQGGYPKLAASAPNSTHQRHHLAVRPRDMPSTRTAVSRRAGAYEARQPPSQSPRRSTIRNPDAVGPEPIAPSSAVVTAAPVQQSGSSASACAAAQGIEASGKPGAVSTSDTAAKVGSTEPINPARSGPPRRPSGGGPPR